MTGLVSTAGVQGYSSPCPDHVVFSVDEGLYGILSQSEAWAGLVAEHLTIGIGCYNGKQETALCLPKEVFDEMYRLWPWIMHDQESILVLGTPESQNWRPATLVYLHCGDRVDLGTWLEVTETEAREQNHWSHFNGHWFICEDDPADSVGTAEERILEAKAALLDRVMPTIAAVCMGDLDRNYLMPYFTEWSRLDQA